MRRLILLFGLVLILALLVAGIGVLVSRRSVAWGGTKVLTWRLDAPLVDYSEAPDLQVFGQRTPLGLAGVHRLLTSARQDPSIAGLGLYIQEARFGYAKAQELRGLLAGFADAGKFVECYLETAGEGSNGTLAYYLASGCDRVVLSPLGEVSLVGLFSDSAFVRGALDKLKIEPQFAHVGDYKSGAEFFTETEHSAAAEEALGAVLDDLFEQVVDGVAAGRGLDTVVVQGLIERAPLTAREALASGLVDEVDYPDRFEQRLHELGGEDAILLPAEEYIPSGRSFDDRRIAVIFAQGTIVRGWSGADPWSQQRYIGAETIGSIARALSEDPRVVGVVLRIDSPGGSPVASDLILRQMSLLAESKPLVVSMSDVAASGGYFIAARGTKVLAEPATITGSIGVFGGKFVTRGFQEAWLGITHDVLKRGGNSDFYSSTVPFSEKQEAHFRSLMEGVYDAFVERVSEGRNLSVAAVERVAGGRIWTGRQALTHGLVDELGGLERAVELTVAAAGLPAKTPVALDYYPRPPSLLELIERTLSPLLSGSVGGVPVLPDLRAPHALELSPELLRLARPE